LLSANAHAITKDQAKRIYDRIAGVPATDAQLTTMAAGTANAAALLATQDPAFYNNTIRNMATPWTNRDQTVFAPLNDYTATVIGMVRDNMPFNTLLSADIIYTADAAAGVPAYSTSNNDMYRRSTTTAPICRCICSRKSVRGDRLADGGDRRRPDHPRRGQCLLHGRHQPPHVPLHHDESSVRRPADHPGHDAAAGSHPPGRDPQPGRRQQPVPEQLHRMPQRHGPHGAGLRVLQLHYNVATDPTGAAGRSSTPPARCSRSTSSTTRTSRRAT
jgi:hypothetical protein